MPLINGASERVSSEPLYVRLDRNSQLQGSSVPMTRRPGTTLPLPDRPACFAAIAAAVVGWMAEAHRPKPAFRTADLGPRADWRLTDDVLTRPFRC